MKGDTNDTISNFIYLVILQKNKDLTLLTLYVPFGARATLWSLLTLPNFQALYKEADILFLYNNFESYI